MTNTNTNCEYTKKDFVSDQEVKWCPGCGDYVILSALQTAMTKTGRKKEDVVFVSGIGCSSRFPYYMDTYGYHSIHGRAPAVASGVKIANPDLSVWVVTGDGDGLSIGGNHLIHILRRNIDINILLFNNEIYGLTKGQYSPTSKQGQVTKTSPYGTIDRPFSAAMLALGSGSTFIARTLDTDSTHMQDIMLEAEQHGGTSFVEIYQNCVIFNDGCHDEYAKKKNRSEHSISLKHGEPMIFGKDRDKGLILDNLEIKIVELGDTYSESDCIVHDKYNIGLASLLVELDTHLDMPKLYGIIYIKDDSTYDKEMSEQIAHVKEVKGEGYFYDLLNSGDTWEVE